MVGITVGTEVVTVVASKTVETPQPEHGTEAVAVGIISVVVTGTRSVTVRVKLRPLKS